MISRRSRISMIAENIYDLKRELGDVTLVAVTKTRPAEDIIAALDAGAGFIGENRVQEAVGKFPGIAKKIEEKDAEFHLIGHLQTNKVKQAVHIFDVIQSVDSLRLAEEIDRRASETGKIQRILLQVNIGQESQKSGADPEAAIDLLKHLTKLNSIKVEGMMCIAPYSVDPEDSRPYFRKMQSLFIEANRILGMKTLSMGMTGDYRVAMEEGSTMVRIGTGIFGGRT